MARGSGVRIRIDADRVPWLAQAEALAQAGFITGASTRNWNSYRDGVTLERDFPEWRRQLLTDPQTSGGLLVACRADRAGALRDAIEAAGYPRASIVGSVVEGDADVTVA